MAETILSPGVFLQESNQSQITKNPITVGAALIGPTVLGKPNIPTVVTSYSQYVALFGNTFISGGVTREYLTSQAAYNYFQQGGQSLLITRVASGSYTPATSSLITTNVPGDTVGAFTLETLSVGTVMNNDFSASYVSSSALQSGSALNVRWEITSANTGSGTFSLNIRRGDDYQNSKNVLESWTNLSLDPNQNNYIEYVIGNQASNVVTDETGQAYLQLTGSYNNSSNYVRVKSVNYTTPNYLNQQGLVSNPSYTASIPQLNSGSSNGAFGGATGPLYGFYNTFPLNLHEAIPTVSATSGVNNIQGVLSTDYDLAINLMNDQSSYIYNLIYAPGLTAQNSPSEFSTILINSQNRGDNIAVLDLVGYGQAVSTVCSLANSYNTSYGATYWPWVQILSIDTGRLHFVPPSTVIPGVYEYNDTVAAEWFAPAGMNRGGLPTVLQPERRLTQAMRDTLYSAKVNPIATFPGQGVVVYGQKTLASQASALNRVNVRRLLIALKSYIGQIAETLVFEQNTTVTRNKFTSQVNPYLASVQQRQGLYSYQVVMDDTNNTPDVIDRNLLVGTIYLQPTKTAEFIQLTFNVQPTGVVFGS